MKKLKGLNYIRTACFLAAFAAVGAGSVFINHTITENAKKEKAVYEKITVSDFARNFELLDTSLIQLQKNESSASLANIKVFAELSGAYLGLIELPAHASELLFSYLSAASRISDAAIENGIAAPDIPENENAFFIAASPTKKAFELLSHYARRITEQALPFLAKNADVFAEKTEKVFSDISLEALISDSGELELIPKNDFTLLRGEKTKEQDAIKTARKVLGKNAFIKAEYSGAEPAGYRINGKNISAVISEDGGFILQMMFDTSISETRLSRSEAQERADAFISERGLDEKQMRVYPLSFTDGLFIFEYVPVQKNVLCKNERIIVSVSGESGRICLYDATEYYRHHKKDLLIPEELISAEEIMSKYSLAEPPELCKISLTGGAEVFCYDIPADEVTLTVNALTGKIIK